jgi:hypothetical protein
MEVKKAIQVLKDHNIWRRFDDENSKSPEMTDPKKLGIAIDKVVSEFENLFLSGVVVAKQTLDCPKCAKSSNFVNQENKTASCFYCGEVWVI